MNAHAPMVEQGAEPWPPNYVQVYAERQKRLRTLRTVPGMVAGAKEYYRTHPIEFIEHWCDTYDPRNAGSAVPARMPFIMFERQRALVRFLLHLSDEQQNGLIEKARDMGATWICAAYSVWKFLFIEGAAIGWGSRKEQLVDKIGDPSSIFEKMRMIVRGLPREFLPRGWRGDDSMTYMKFINPENGSTITGEAGDNIGRGGRTSEYFKDESAHYERPEKIEAALGDNTRVQIDISSVNGPGNVFHRRREAGEVWEPDGAPIKRGTLRVFIMDWSDHPAKTQEWYDERRRNAESAGLLHLFAQEVDRDYLSAVDGVIIPAKYVKAAVDAHLKLGFTDDGPWRAGLDVADGGIDLNALAVGKGPVVKSIESWGERDVGVTTRRTLNELQGIRVAVQYDALGVGSGVKSEVNRLAETLDSEGRPLLPDYLEFVPWAGSAKVLHPERRLIEDDKQSLKNKDFYQNLKAQAWWQLRLRFERTYRAVVEGVEYDPDLLISLPSTLPNLRQLQKELSQATVSSATSSLKLVVDKSPEGTRSPNLADAVVMMYWPTTKAKPLLSLGSGGELIKG